MEVRVLPFNHFLAALNVQDDEQHESDEVKEMSCTSGSSTH